MFVDPADPRAGMPNAGTTPRAQLLQQAVIRAQNAPGNTPYFTGTQYQNQMVKGGANQGQVQASAQTYAKQQLLKYAQIAQLMGGKFGQAFQQQDQSDPASAYRALSGIFSQQSQAQGVADPRQLLLQLLLHARASGAAGGAGMTSMPHGSVL